MRKLRFFVAITAGTLVASSASAERGALTPSGQPDVMFRGIDAAEAGSKVANHCLNVGWQVTDQTPNQITCQVPMSAMRSALTQALIGNSYSTAPLSFVRVTLVKVGGNTRGQATAWVETQMAFGQMRRQQFTDDKTFNNLLGFLVASGGELPPGTRIAGIWMGVDGKPISDGKSAYIPVTRVLPNSPGAKAGIQVGDQVTEVNGKKFKSLEDMKKSLNHVGIGVSYPVVLLRNGVKQTVMLEAQERPVVGTPEYEAAVENSNNVPAPTPVSTMSAATPK